MATGWWGQYAANPTRQPYAGYLSYLDYVIPASTQLVTSPTITPEGVVRNESTSAAAGGGSAVEGTTTTGTPNVGEAAAASAHAQSSIFGGAVSKGDMTNLGAVNSALALLGLPSVPAFPAGMLFTLTNNLMGRAEGLNTDPLTGLPVGGKEFQSLMADPIFSQFIDFSAPALSPLASATIGPISANQEGFSISPMAVGTPFSSNPPTVPSQTNFAQTARGDQGEAGNPTGVTAGNVSATAGISGISDAPGNTGVGEGGTADGPGIGGAGEGMRWGGAVRDTQPGGGDNERRRLMAGEYVVRRSSAAKYRPLLEAINRGAHPKVVARVAGKLARRMAA